MKNPKHIVILILLLIQFTANSQQIKDTLYFCRGTSIYSNVIIEDSINNTRIKLTNKDAKKFVAKIIIIKDNTKTLKITIKFKIFKKEVVRYVRIDEIEKKYIDVSYLNGQIILVYQSRIRKRI